MEVSEELRTLEPYKKISGEKIPVTGYDPVQYYLKELEVSFFNAFHLISMNFDMYLRLSDCVPYWQVAFSEYALFFHDVFGGDVIGVVWKPQAQESKEFKVLAQGSIYSHLLL